MDHFSVILVQAAYFSLAANKKSRDRAARAPRERGVVVRRTLVVVEELGRSLIAPQAIFFRSHHKTGKLIGVSAVREIGDL